MAKARLCIDCGVDISDLYHNVKRCKECAHTHKTTRCRDWQRNKVGAEIVKVCATCWVEFECTRTNQRYCTNCSPYRNDKTAPTCIDCGGGDVKARGDRCPPCSKRHKADKQRERAAAKRPPPLIIKCGRCGKDVEARGKHQKWCVECAPIIDREKAKAKYWEDPAAHAAKVREWHQERIVRDPEYRERVYDRARARRDQLANADEETVYYRTVLRGDLCSYCGEPAGTIDHIVPLSEGGENHWSNLTAACFPCNASKNDRGDIFGWMLERKQRKESAA